MRDGKRGTAHAKGDISIFTSFRVSDVLPTTASMVIS